MSIVAVGSTQNRTAALSSGAIQAGLAEPPDSLSLEASGLHPLVDVSSLHIPAATAGVFVQRSFLDQDRDAVQRYVDAMIDAMVAEKTDRAGSIATLEKYFQSTDAQVMGETADHANQDLFTTLPYPRPEQLQDAAAQLSVTTPQVASYDVSKMMDPSLVQSAADRGIGARLQ